MQRFRGARANLFNCANRFHRGFVFRNLDFRHTDYICQEHVLPVFYICEWTLSRIEGD